MNGFEEGIAKLIRKAVSDVIPIYYDLAEGPFNYYLEMDGRKIYFPDFALVSKFTLRKVCWVEVKSTQSIYEEGKDFNWINEAKECSWYLWSKYIGKSKLWYNLDVEKHRNYNIVAEISGLPVFLIIFSKNKMYWGRVDIYEPELKNIHYKAERKETSRNLIPISENLKLLARIIEDLVKVDQKQG